MFDHSAIVGLSRMIVEGLTMYAYLKQTMPDDVWTLRETVLKLHDTVARITLFRAYREKPDYQDLRDGRDLLLRDLEANSTFRSLQENQQASLRQGAAIFVGGMRRAAREAGWDEARFTAMYGYLSAHVHGAPMSYFRTPGARRRLLRAQRSSEGHRCNGGRDCDGLSSSGEPQTARGLGLAKPPGVRGIR